MKVKGKLERTETMYYAIYHPYGIHTISHGDTLIRFETAARRNRFIDEKNRSSDGIRFEAVARDHARALFPRAFNVRDSGTDCECWSAECYISDSYYAEIWTGAPTGGKYGYMD